ncbi:dTDP-glucose 4,6-dehydratase [Gramella sp. MAR_2010_147]|uniref:dTDP-glucose 4,6-dehydratase n=1 Tax=Gramella sp. MAR_2010_147 TaxID=1250205 RepID=UPI0008794F10|nr:dTDP-glucose 4,6-dehydratase [Gramella sp. MAR_2010_147]SDS17766.1 dTDP-glucose 4,6-dehydratase [Gramella sp. MAR_2010_147]
MNILITGGAGFIGSNFIPYFLESNPGYTVINLDLLTYAGDLNNLKEIERHPRYKFIQGNINDEKLVKGLFSEFNIKGVINFAAESHVDNSIEEPEVFIKTNINGTFTLLSSAYRHWMAEPGVYKENYKESRFHQISTDEVYGSLGAKGLFTEETPYAPNSPYSASKASGDMLVRSYHHTYGMNTVISNCSNNYGPKQNNEKLIPTVIRKALAGESIPIYGDGQNIRDWLYVRDHCIALNAIFRKGKSGEIYNVGGNNELDNLSVANKICGILDKKKPLERGSYRELIKFVKDRAGHDRRYAVDSSKIQKELGWSPNENFESGLHRTIEWYLNQ